MAAALCCPCIRSSAHRSLAQLIDAMQRVERLRDVAQEEELLPLIALVNEIPQALAPITAEIADDRELDAIVGVLLQNLPGKLRPQLEEILRDVLFADEQLMGAFGDTLTRTIISSASCTSPMTMPSLAMTATLDAPL